MKLQDRVEHWGLSRNSTVSYDMLANVVTFRRTGPKQEAEVERYIPISANGKSNSVELKCVRKTTDTPSLSQFSCLHSYGCQHVPFEQFGDVSRLPLRIL